MALSSTAVRDACHNFMGHSASAAPGLRFVFTAAEPLMTHRYAVRVGYSGLLLGLTGYNETATPGIRPNMNECACRLGSRNR